MYRTTRSWAPPVVQSLMIINAAMWLLSLMSDGMTILALFPAESPWFRLWQPLTYMFMHGSWEHIIFNMFTLWMFGRFIEYDLGSRRFLLYYMVCGVGAGLIQLLICHLTGAPLNVPTVGASGAIYGLLLAFGMLHPSEIIMPLIPPIPMKAKWAVMIFGGMELVLGLLGGALDNVAHFAHLGGMVWGVALLLMWKRQGKIYRR